MTQLQRKPRRTLGLSLAILTSVFLFSLLPLMQAARLLTLRARLTQIEGTPQPVASGIDYLVGSETEVWIRAALGIVFLGIALLAWRGKPAGIQKTMTIAIVVLTLITIGFTIVPLIARPTLEAGLNSGQPVTAAWLASQLCAAILIPLYALWYLHRAPARAFYRGYYLPNPAESMPSKPP
jgi:cytochrome bd-type quinol oxidase subunit 2